MKKAFISSLALSALVLTSCGTEVVSEPLAFDTLIQAHHQKLVDSLQSISGDIPEGSFEQTMSADIDLSTTGAEVGISIVSDSQVDADQGNTESDIQLAIKADIQDAQTFPIAIVADLSANIGVKTFANALYLQVTNGDISLPDMIEIEQSIGSYITLLSDKWIKFELDEAILSADYSLDANVIFSALSSSLTSYPLLNNTDEGILADGKQVFAVELNNEGITQLISSLTSIGSPDMNEADIQEMVADIEEELEDISLAGTFSVVPGKEELYSLDAIITDTGEEVLRIQIEAEEDSVSIVLSPLNNVEAMILTISSTRGETMKGTMNLTEEGINVFQAEFEFTAKENKQSATIEGTINGASIQMPDDISMNIEYANTTSEQSQVTISVPTESVSVEDLQTLLPVGF